MKRRKATSDKVSSIAGWVLEGLADFPRYGAVLLAPYRKGDYRKLKSPWLTVQARDLKALAASVLSQDETKGPRLTVDTRGVSKNDYLFQNAKKRKRRK